MFVYQLSNIFLYFIIISCVYEFMNIVDYGIFVSVKYVNMGNVDGVYGIINYNSFVSVFIMKYYEIY